MKRLARNFTYANVCATLALFVAVSTGGAYAASQIDGRTIKPNSIPATALMNNSVTSAKIKNGQVVALDVKKGALTPAVFNAATQKQLASVGGGAGVCNDGTTNECAREDVVPTGVGQPCHALGQPEQGVWSEPATGFWLCSIDKGNGVTSTSAPAKAGQYSGAVNG